MFGAILMVVGEAAECGGYFVTAGAVAALVITGWLVVLAIAILSAR
jgi:hypothetical protein